MKIIMATDNEHKLREIREMMSGLGVIILSKSEAGADIAINETGTTFEENAYIKARAIYERTNTPCIADDSGLEVDHLEGKPGIFSARYAPENECCEKLLSELEGVPENERKARFVSSICYVNGKGNSFTVRGAVEGFIGYEKRGNNGFGYDPVFMYNDKSFAELSSDEKNSISHRFKALEQIYRIIENDISIKT